MLLQDYQWTGSHGALCRRQVPQASEEQGSARGPQTRREQNELTKDLKKSGMNSHAVMFKKISIQRPLQNTRTRVTRVWELFYLLVWYQWSGTHTETIRTSQDFLLVWCLYICIYILFSTLDLRFSWSKLVFFYIIFFNFLFKMLSLNAPHHYNLNLFFK